MKKDSFAGAIVETASMRLIGISVLTLAVVAATAVSAGAITVESTRGAAYVELLHGHGYAKISSLGAVFGKIWRGRIVATRNVRFSWNCHRQAVAGTSLVQCRGHRIYFRTPGHGARWRVMMTGRGINASGVARGCLVLNGVDSGRTGQYRLGGSGLYHTWPRRTMRHRLGYGRC
jgi:hypothetical protein